MSQSDRDALMRLILEHSEDDTSRLVFADWLAEHRAERTRFL